MHREQIAKQSITAYKHVFSDQDKFGLLSGNSKEYDKPYLIYFYGKLGFEQNSKNYFKLFGKTYGYQGLKHKIR